MMNTNSSIARLLAKALRDVGLWVAKRTNRRDAEAMRIALAKRQLERELRAKGTPRTFARLLVAEQFRQRELNKGH
ncbi:hypothetical protein ACNKW1_02345 [Thauera sp. WH-2]|uniref:hypothetical protein n=1 Tax=Thauera sp. WH-2 TaxID=3401574 RepID=UPI003AB01C12